MAYRMDNRRGVCLFGRFLLTIALSVLDIYAVAAVMGLRVKRKVEIISFVKMSLTSTIF
jgi:hypothetical protein